MTKADAQKLYQLFLAGYLICIDAEGYVDSPVQDMNELETVDPLDPARTSESIVYDSEVYSERPLSEVSVKDVKVYQPVDWYRVDFKPEEDVYIS